MTAGGSLQAKLDTVSHRQPVEKKQQSYNQPIFFFFRKNTTKLSTRGSSSIQHELLFQDGLTRKVPNHNQEGCDFDMSFFPLFLVPALAMEFLLFICLSPGQSLISLLHLFCIFLMRTNCWLFVLKISCLCLLFYYIFFSCIAEGLGDLCPFYFLFLLVGWCSIKNLWVMFTRL